MPEPEKSKTHREDTQTRERQEVVQLLEADTRADTRKKAVKAIMLKATSILQEKCSTLGPGEVGTSETANALALAIGDAMSVGLQATEKIRNRNRAEREENVRASGGASGGASREQWPPGGAGGSGYGGSGGFG